MIWQLMLKKFRERYHETDIQSNSVITNSMGPSVSVRYNSEIVITVKIYVIK